MPNYFTLTRKSNPEAGPVSFVTIDEELCQHFCAICHPENWFEHWYPLFMEWGIAIGRSFERQRADVLQHIHEARKRGDNNLVGTHQIQLEILDWLDTYFTPSAWAQIGK